MRKSNVGVGYVARVSHFQWVTIENKRPLLSENSTFRKGSVGSISKGGTLLVLEELDSGEILARYTTKWNRPVSGAPLPSGAVIKFPNINVLREMNRMYRKMSLLEKRSFHRGPKK